MRHFARLLSIRFAAVVLISGFSVAIFAQPMLRRHTKTQLGAPLRTIPARKSAPGQSQVVENTSGQKRLIRSNGIPEHKVGTFPNSGNPNRIYAQRYQYQIDASPSESNQQTPVPGFKFGVAVNGVPFDPGAAEFYLGRHSIDWQYEALAGVVPLGLDENHAHVQPGGQYHYHGLPVLLMKELGVKAGEHSPQIGWAADGFPIYALYGYSNPEDPESEVVELKTSYQLKSGNRPTGNGNPGGVYDGTFVGDYEYQVRLGDLDQCNGRQCVTPEFPEGTYAYFLTSEWPVIPRVFKGTPSQDFRGGPGPMGPGGGGRRGGPPGRPPFGPPPR